MIVLFLSYGTGPHQDEVHFAIRCLQHMQALQHCRPVVYTDSVQRFRRLPVDIVEVSTSQWRDWGGPHNFNHRRKILALDQALQNSTDPVVLMDGDTYLRKPITQLADRIGPGRGIMHIREGQVSRVQSPLYQQLRQLLSNEAVQGCGIPTDAWMWNAGVIGLHPQQRPLLQQVLQLTDLLCQHSSLHILEQFAFSWILSQQIDLRPADDVVFHYWPPYLHKPFRQKLATVMSQGESLPASQQPAFYFSHRPRPTATRRCKVLVKRLLESLGLLHGYCRSNEW